jgi:hypothetical protein
MHSTADVLFGGASGVTGARPPDRRGRPADYLLVESTTAIASKQDDNGDRLAAIVTETAHKGETDCPGVRDQARRRLIYWLKRLEAEKRIPCCRCSSTVRWRRRRWRLHGRSQLDPGSPRRRDDKAPHDAAAPHPPDITATGDAERGWRLLPGASL